MQNRGLVSTVILSVLLNLGVVGPAIEAGQGVDAAGTQNPVM